MAERAPSPSLRLRLRRLRRRLSFLAVSALTNTIGFAGAGRFGRLLGELQYRFSFWTRPRLQRDMARILGRDVSDPEVRSQLHHAYRVNNGAVMEIITLMNRHQDAELLKARCEIDGMHNLQTALDEGRGVILLGAHMGNGVLMTIKLALLGYPLTVIFRESRMMSAGFFQDGYARYGVQGVLANSGMRAYTQMLKALRKGRIVYILMDQGVKHARDGQMQRFLGKDVAMPAGPAQLARHTGAPILPVMTTACDPLWRFRIEPPEHLAAEAPLEADVAQLTQLTERIVRSRPELWSWHHRRWRKFPLASPTA